MRQTFGDGAVVQSRSAAEAGTTTTTTGAPVRAETWQKARPVFPAEEIWRTPAPFSRRRSTVGWASSSLKEQVSIRPPRSGQ